MRLVGALVPRLPEAALATAAELAGAASYVVARGARRASAGNLAAAVDPGDPDLVALRVREAFRVQARNYVDLFRIPGLSLAEVERRVELVGWEQLQRALTQGRGAILATAHLGNVDLVAQLACARGLAVTIPVESIEPPALLAYVTRLRAAHGLRLIPIGPGVLPVLAAALRRGEVVGFAVDRDAQGPGQDPPVLGRQARLSHAPALLALRTGAPVVPAAVRRLPGGRFAATLHQPIWAHRGARPAEVMRKVVRPLEEAIRQTPGQWVMFQPLFLPEAR
jgi:lauroyl/myristoyl acyltransferase